MISKFSSIASTILLSCAVLTVSCSPMPAFEEEYERFNSIAVGMTEQEVLERLGSPTLSYLSDDAPEDYYVEGYSFKKRPITHKVLIYVGSEPIAYIYLDKQEKVEDVFVGGS